MHKSSLDSSYQHAEVQEAGALILSDQDREARLYQAYNGTLGVLSSSRQLWWSGGLSREATKRMVWVLPVNTVYHMLGTDYNQQRNNG